MEEIKISTNFIKLDALLKFSGLVATGGEAKQMVNEGIVAVNGEPCTMRGKKCFPGDVITVGDQKIRVIYEN